MVGNRKRHDYRGLVRTLVYVYASPALEIDVVGGSFCGRDERWEIMSVGGCVRRLFVGDVYV